MQVSIIRLHVVYTVYTELRTLNHAHSCLVASFIKRVQTLPVFCPLQVSAVKYHTKAMSTFHQINAFEEDGFLMLDLCCADDGKAINNYLLQNLRKSGEALNEVRQSEISILKLLPVLQPERCILSLWVFCSQVYDSLCRPYPRRFVLPLRLSDETPLEQNLNTRPSSQATCVKVGRDKASQSWFRVRFQLR